MGTENPHLHPSPPDDAGPGTTPGQVKTELTKERNTISIEYPFQWCRLPIVEDRALHLYFALGPTDSAASLEDSGRARAGVR